jgi:hypothetical protein
MFAYTVRCEFTVPAVADEWVEWLAREHLGEVCAAGAMDAEVIRVDSQAPGDPVVCEVRYHFASRHAFQEYARNRAPRLRAAGLARFAPQRGITYGRATGEVVAVAAARAPRHGA